VRAVDTDRPFSDRGAAERLLNTAVNEIASEALVNSGQKRLKTELLRR
jgi:hypothetical protein